MGQRVSGWILTLIIVSMTLSGCMSSEGYNSENDATLGEEPPYTEDGIFTCIEHDNLSRCWQTHVPENLDINETVPLIIDMHGYASDSTFNRALSTF